MKLNWPGAGSFWFWAAALLVLPNCSLDTTIVPTGTNLRRGLPPHSSALFCEIERPAGRRCATPADLAAGIRLNEAAIALVAGRSSAIGLDDSPAALARCSGQPEAVEFFGPFPAGLPVCLNCSVIGPPPALHEINDDVCTAHCLDLFRPRDVNVPPSVEAVAFCAIAAGVATNFPDTGCFDSACSTMGGLRADFDDPRRHLEPVEWINPVGVLAGSNGTVTRFAPFTGNFDAGASSSQRFFRGDAYLEFRVDVTTNTRIGGLSSGLPPPGGVQFPDIEFGIELLGTGEMFVVENGAAVSSFGAYALGERFRVKLRDNFDGTATVSYARVTGPCEDGTPCSEAVFHTSTNLATYPVRADAMFLDLNASLVQARIVRIR